MKVSEKTGKRKKKGKKGGWGEQRENEKEKGNVTPLIIFNHIELLWAY